MRLIESAGRRAVMFPCDIREESACQGLVDRAVEAFGGIDVPVNNAAYQMSRPKGLEEIPTEQFDRVMRTNFLASQQAGYITAEIVSATGGTPLP